MSSSDEEEQRDVAASRRSSSPAGTRPGSPGPNVDSSMMDVDGAASSSKRKSKGAAGASGQSGSFPIGKIRHLKKEDGEPLWRRDIQYDFLKAVFDDERRVFTNNYEKGGPVKQNFADLYIDTMARSSKTSKVLRDKLLSDREAAKGMAMVCLLVNVGRMNTTLNFFPEMRAQLRTYHAIPSLQAHADASAYKQLQDAPRLKSILKGAAEDMPEPRELSAFKDKEPPRTNPVNLIFLICQHATHVAELHFPSDHEFHDLIMKTKYTSQSRANAFLWVVWFYLESDFTEEGCEENPFGAGVDYGTEVANQGVPKLEEMTAEEEAQENIDPEEELTFGKEKQAHRAKIIAADQAYMADHQTTKRASRGGKQLNEDSPAAAVLPRIRPSKHESDMDSTRSTPPPRALGRAGPGSTARRSGGAPLKYQIFEASSPAPHSQSMHAVDGIVPRKPRPPTAHQLAVERNRNQRVEYILDRGLRKHQHRSRKARRQQGVLIPAKRRLDAVPDPFIDSGDEDNSKAPSIFRDTAFGGLCQLKSEDDTFGEDFVSYAKALRRAHRRMKRWHPRAGRPQEIVAPVKMKSGSRPHADAARRDGGAHVKPGVNGKSPAAGDASESEGDLDDMDKQLLGLAGDGEGDDDDELDDVEKTLLGMDSDGS